MSEDQPIQREPKRDELAELEPHQEVIEQAADLYFSACRKLARTINRLKGKAEEKEEGR